jgi:hypothetical protein
MEWNNVFLTAQLEQERMVMFVRVTGVSRGSYSKGFVFFISVGWGSSVSHGTKFVSGKNLLGDNELTISHLRLL